MADTLAHRKIIGVLVPYFNSVVEPELADLRPAGVSNQTARFELDADVLRNVREAAERLATCRPDALIIGLAAESFPGGLTLLQQSAEELRRQTKLPVYTASHATHAALRHLGARRIGVVTPFDAEGNSHVRAAFEEHGFDVVSIGGLACARFDEIAQTPLNHIRAMFRTVSCAEAEALVQVGTGLPVLHLVDELERDLAKPVVACNAASYWQALRELGIQDSIGGFGRLLAR
jgi:maleate isomerase